MDASTVPRRAHRTTAIIAVLAIVAVVGGAIPAGAVAPGPRLWGRRYDGPASGRDEANDVALSPDGGTIFVTGRSAGVSTGADYLTRAYVASTGARVWTTRYDGPVGLDDIAHDIAVSPDGSTVFVTGQSAGSEAENDFDFTTIAYDAATGEKLWAKRLDGSAHSNDVAFALALSPEGDVVYVTGTSIGATTGFDYMTRAYDAGTGAKLWTKRYNGRANGNDQAFAIAPTPDGSIVLVTGLSSASNGWFDWATLAYDAVTGAKVWGKRYNGPANDSDYANALVVDPNGGTVYVTGTSTGFGTRLDHTTIAYDVVDGEVRWTMRHAGPSDGDDVAYAVAVSSDGARVFVGGFGPTVAYEAATGTELWAKHYTDDLFNVVALAVSADGAALYATGDDFPTNLPSNMGTLAYDTADGAQLWARSYDGPASGEDGGTSIVADTARSRIFVAGRSAGGTTGMDYITISYTA